MPTLPIEIEVDQNTLQRDLRQVQKNYQQILKPIEQALTNVEKQIGKDAFQANKQLRVTNNIVKNILNSEDAFRANGATINQNLKARVRLGEQISKLQKEGLRDEQGNLKSIGQIIKQRRELSALQRKANDEAKITEELAFNVSLEQSHQAASVDPVSYTHLTLPTILRV